MSITLIPGNLKIEVIITAESLSNEKKVRVCLPNQLGLF